MFVKSENSFSIERTFCYKIYIYYFCSFVACFDLLFSFFLFALYNFLYLNWPVQAERHQFPLSISKEDEDSSSTLDILPFIQCADS